MYFCLVVVFLIPFGCGELCFRSLLEHAQVLAAIIGKFSAV